MGETLTPGGRAGDPDDPGERLREWVAWHNRPRRFPSLRATGSPRRRTGGPGRGFGFGPPPEDPGPADDGRRGSFLRRRIAPLGAAILAFLAKLKAILLFLGKFKLLVTAGSMAVSLAAYATIWGWTSRSASSCCCSCTRWDT